MSQRLLPLWRTVPPTTERVSDADPGPDFTVHVASADECECGHPIADHDAIATRYCRATTTGALPRGCMCPPSTALLGTHASGFGDEPDPASDR